MSKQKQKEPLSLMIARTALAIAVFTGLGTIIFGGGVVIMKYYSNEANNRIVESVDQETENYYDVLEKKCAGDGCCLSSFKTMKANNYKEADENGKCPEGFYMDMVKCVTSYQWCVPMEKNCAKIGESVGTCVGCIEKCCQGLKPMVNLKYNGECVDLPAPGSGGVCSNCGNGICDDENNEDECNCPEDCGEEIDELLYCEKDNDCTVYFSHCDCEYHCANRNIEIVDCMVDCDETGLVISECVCENNKCVDKKSDTSDWQTYRNEEFGFEFKYPILGVNNEKIFIKEKNNLIQICVKIYGDNDFCHHLKYYEKPKEETVEDSIRRQILDEDEQTICIIEKKGFGLENKFKAYYYINCPSVGPSGFAYNHYISDSNYPELFLMYSIGHDTVFDVDKWINSIKFIES